MGAGLSEGKDPPADPSTPSAAPSTEQSLLGTIAPVVLGGIIPGGLPPLDLDPDGAPEANRLSWYVYLLGGALTLGGMYVVWRIVKEGAAVALPLAFGGEMGTAMALERLAQLTGTGVYTPPGGSAFAAQPEAPAPRSAPVRRRPPPVEVVEAPAEGSDDGADDAEPAPQTLASPT